ncbi:MAG: IclR family transcriptional regulator [Lentisphaeria bacterium]|jgi:DNA-binding IclR family transcriptional regulator
MVQSVNKALTLLNTVASHGDWIGVRELARLTGMKPPTAQQLLKTLQARQYLEFDEDSRRYRVGLAAVFLGRAADLPARLGDLARPHVQALFREFGETTVALACDRGAFQCVCSRTCEKELSTSVPPTGELADPHLMACGQALLAWQDVGTITAYLQARPRHAEIAGLEQRLRAVRDAGHAELTDYNRSGVAAFGVPVFDAAGRGILALGISVPLSRFDVTLGKQIVRRIVAAAQAMSRSLKETGHREDPRD